MKKYFPIVSRTNGDWDDPCPLEYDGSAIRTGYPSLSRNGNLCFSHRCDNISGIYRSQLINGTYQTPGYQCSVSDTVRCEGDMCIAPDERFMIVSCWDLPENSGESDLFISFRKEDGRWTAFKNMGDPINTKHNEGCPIISPDGKYFFYLSVDGESEPARCMTYWVDAKVIEELKSNK